MSIIDTQNAKKIRDAMEIYVRVEATINGSVVTYDYTNDDIISCELNLRADLSPIDPALPESEIVVKVYSPEDVSDVVKNIANDQPLTYWAGYDGVYSTVRKFYISEPVTWEEKIITFKAVDAVHFLDQEHKAIWCGTSAASNSGRSALRFTKNSSGTALTTASVSYNLTAAFDYLCSLSGVTLIRDHSGAPSMGASAVPSADATFIIPRESARDSIANLMNLTRLDFPSGAFNRTALYLTYVDAGIPTYNYNKPVSKWNIYAEDCGDIQEHTARDIVEIAPKNMALLLQDFDRSYGFSNPKIGSISISKDSGGSVSIDKVYAIVGNAKLEQYSTWLTPIALGSIQYTMQAAPTNSVYFASCGYFCFNDGGFMPWDSSLQAFWDEALQRGDIEANAESASFDLYGGAITGDDPEDSYTKSGYGVHEAPSKTSFIGKACLKGQNGTTYEFLPKMGYQQLLNRSNKTGSFTWKGDPRMQPRDVFTWHNLDGTTEERTIETISLKHEGGGTLATITYRKGIV